MLTFETRDKGGTPSKKISNRILPFEKYFFNKRKKQETTERGEKIERKNKDRL